MSGAFIKEYEFDCKARKLGVNTIQGYMRMLHYLMTYLDKDYGISQIEDTKLAAKIIGNDRMQKLLTSCEIRSCFVSISQRCRAAARWHGRA